MREELARVNGYPAGEPLAVVERSGRIESVHRGHLIILDGAGVPVLRVGEPDAAFFGRSSNKPMQVVGMLAAGLNLTTDQLALAAASHSGEPKHVSGVRSTLAAYDVDESELGCPPALPLNEPAAEEVVRAGGHRQPIYMNCSGKHAAMLATCAVNNWSRPDYLDPDHPLQQRVTATIRDLTGAPVAAIGVDGCGAPVAATSLAGLAAAFLALVDADDGPARAVAVAMRTRPDLVGGTGRSGTLLMQAIPGLLAKEGAEGVFALALPGVGAVAVKIDDGAQRGADAVVVAALARLGVVNDVLVELPSLSIAGGGRQVGTVRSVLPER